MKKGTIGIQIDLALLSTGNEKYIDGLSREAFLKEHRTLLFNVPRQSGKTVEIIRRFDSKDVLVVPNKSVLAQFESIFSIIHWRDIEQKQMNLKVIVAEGRDKQSFWCELMKAEDDLGGKIKNIYIDEFGSCLQVLDYLHSYNFRVTDSLSLPNIIGVGTGLRLTK